MRKANSWYLAVLMMCCTLGVWGCNSQKNGAYNAKIREMESRYAKLEDDFRVVTTAADQARKKLTQAETRRVESEEKNSELTKKVEELTPIVSERDELKKQVQTRTTERDGFQGQLLQFSKDLQSLAGRVETAAASPGVTIINAVPASRSSEKTE